jgi:4-phospho-D-threonate 3-dehydrogenase / 4-phospho-D-erythronate 3-dehydrogenase
MPHRPYKPSNRRKKKPRFCYTQGMNRPLIAMTMGDPAGIGPETIVGAWGSPVMHTSARPFCVGRRAIFARAVALLRQPIEVVEIDDPGLADPSPNRLPVLVAGDANADAIPPARVDARGGRAAYDCLMQAIDLAKHGRIDAFVTAPLNKAALAAAGIHHPGHTEILAEACDVPPESVAMMLYLPPDDGVRGPAGLGVAHVTLHMALRDVFQHITPSGIHEKARLAHDVARVFLPDDARRAPRIGIAAINPHAGEDGLFGDEEIKLIAPTVAKIREQGIDAHGPFPADTLLSRAAAGEFDAVVAMYHDQGHIALKLLGMHRAVNITLGLPIIRTSVAHGTAFDKAWQGKAETTGLIAATQVAVKLALAKFAPAKQKTISRN